MFRSYQTILRELSCLVFKLLEAACIYAPLVMLQHAFSSGYVSVARTGFVQNQFKQQTHQQRKGHIT